jgi:isopenicillin N synthase-like dioxygenase
MAVDTSNQHLPSVKNPLYLPPLDYTQLKWYSEQDIPTSILVLDYQRLLEGKDWSILKDVLYQGKVFYLKNLGISDEEVEVFLNVTREFFNRPASEKSTFVHPQITPIWRGYSSFRVDRTADLPTDQRPPEVTMNYTWGANENIYPNEKFRQIWQSHYVKRFNIVRSLTEIIVEVLSLKENTEWVKLFTGETLLRHQCYPAIPPQAEYRISAHVDTTILSLLNQIPAENGYIGLEIWSDDQFVKAPAVKGTAVINIGEVLYAFSKGVIKPTKHRVVNPTRDYEHSERTSIPVFFHAAKDLEITCPQDSTYTAFYNQEGKTTVATFLNNAVKAFTNKY